MSRPVFDLAQTYVEARLALDPYGATFLGAPGYDDKCTDLSPRAARARVECDKSFLEDLAKLPAPTDDAERVAIEVIRERIDARVVQFTAGEHLRDLGVLWSSAHLPRMVFDLMPRTNDAEWANVAARLEGVEAALAGARASLVEGMSQGLFAARRQAVGVAKTFAVWCGTEAEGSAKEQPWFAGLVAEYAGHDQGLKARLAVGADSATAAYGQLVAFLQDEYAPAAPDHDGVGEERYSALARYWTGADLNLRETYAWGWSEVERIASRIREVCGVLRPGLSPEAVAAELDEDPAYQIAGEQNLLTYLQELTDRTTADFAEKYFEIPDVMLRCEARLAPPGGAAAPYYNGPSEDFSRPGTTWFPTQGQDSFSTWRLPTIWYHEAVPGHHLQVGYSVYRADRLTRVQRMEFVSGHGEGWALYAERLMDELGYFTDPATELGFLSAQVWRAVRIVLDIGLHLGLPVPAGEQLAGAPTAGSEWTRDNAVVFLRTQALLAQGFAESEVDRYLGLAGQAISYKVGERVWLDARADAQSRHGDSFDLKAWHAYALALGSMGLDPLRAELARF